MNKRKLSFIKSGLILSASFALVVGCSSANAGNPQQQAETKEDVHWSYEGENGPENWGKLKPEFAACEEGKEQSPIDISEYKPADLVPIKFGYHAADWGVVNNGHTIQANIASQDNTIKLDGTTYTLQQFHFHTPSEHTIDGKPTDMELHLVHQDKDGNLAVVGLMIKEGKENHQLTAVWDKMPKEESKEEVALGKKLDASALLPDDASTYRYKGSLTTPPCSEGVNWSVVKQPIEMSKAQIDAFKEIFPMNSRPVQPVHEREILEEKSEQ
ncbi:carbonic anhydrase [Desmospora activa]|uniref:carbonic anhydrase n=1 Tax=Desmospora activa DSM 45169 TaxID=1121389 RepID=A0A2T4ZA86_9BACL|nr:carbonic anhydrase family protein [Desmospora activa]PTM58789.1 carbonic anhydrase [Desmospora activa DSM 45169]